MTLRQSLVLSVALFVATSTLSAFQAKPVDLTGVWTGTLTRAVGEPAGAHLDLKQKGAELTGTAGPAADRQLPIANGKVTTVKDVTSVTFDVTQPNGLLIKFDLKLVDGRLKGKTLIEANGETREGILDAGRAK